MASRTKNGLASDSTEDENLRLDDARVAAARLNGAVACPSPGPVRGIARPDMECSRRPPAPECGHCPNPNCPHPIPTATATNDLPCEKCSLSEAVQTWTSRPHLEVRAEAQVDEIERLLAQHAHNPVQHIEIVTLRVMLRGFVTTRKRSDRRNGCGGGAPGVSGPNSNADVTPTPCTGHFVAALPRPVPRFRATRVAGTMRSGTPPSKIATRTSLLTGSVCGMLTAKLSAARVNPDHASGRSSRSRGISRATRRKLKRPISWCTSFGTRREGKQSPWIFDPGHRDQRPHPGTSWAPGILEDVRLAAIQDDFKQRQFSDQKNDWFYFCSLAVTNRTVLDSDDLGGAIS